MDMDDYGYESDSDLGDPDDFTEQLEETKPSSKNISRNALIGISTGSPLGRN
jgi:hypothetical protein